MMKTIYPKSRSSGIQPLPAGRICSAHSQGLASASAGYQFFL